MTWHSHRKDNGILNVPPNDVLIRRAESERTGKLKALTERRGMGKTHMAEGPFSSDGLSPLAQNGMKFTRIGNGSHENQSAPKPILTVPPDARAGGLSLGRDAIAFHDVSKSFVALVLGIFVFGGEPARQDPSREKRLNKIGSKVYRTFFRARRIGRERGGCKSCPHRQPEADAEQANGTQRNSPRV
jgi:hypothetical protein